MFYNLKKYVYQYRKGFIAGTVVSLFIVLSMVALNMTSVYAMELKETELNKYYESRERLIEDKSYLVFCEYIENHMNDENMELKIYTDIVEEAEKIMEEYYGK